MQKTLRPMFAVGCPRCKKLGGRCLRSAARDAKNFAADVCGRLPEMQKNFAADVCGGCPRCKKLGGRCLRRLPEMSKLGGRCLRSAARDAKTWRPMFAVGCRRCKNLAADVCGRLPEMQKLFGRCLRLAASKGTCASGCKSLSQQNVSRPVIHLHKQALRVGFPGLQKLSRTLWWKPESWNGPQEQMGPKPQVSTLISEAKVGTWSETRQRESWNLYCRERGTAITTTAPVLQRNRNYNCYDRSSIANSKKNAITTTAPLLQREGNCNYHDRSNAERERETVIIATLSNIAEREKPELLGPLQYCRDRNCNDCDPSSMAEREIAINYYDRSSIAERYVYGDPTIISLYSQWYDPMDRRRT